MALALALAPELPLELVAIAIALEGIEGVTGVALIGLLAADDFLMGVDGGKSLSPLEPEPETDVEEGLEVLEVLEVFGFRLEVFGFVAAEG